MRGGCTRRRDTACAPASPSVSSQPEVWGQATRAACPLECDGDGCDKSGSLGPNATAAELRVASILADQSGGGRWPILEAGRTLLRRAAVNGSSEPEAYASEIRFGGMAQLSAPDAEALQATIQSTVPESSEPGAGRLVGEQRAAPEIYPRSTRE